ncbi:NAD(P)-binding protein [Mycena venus]|uniref:NAD(P)-binding protein n=1 Tax=Mycena venus TaxID=2733690 RepID=A0A8H6YQW2_9AGAR|nr:NAD(P)-binding protein [Mycena venus]
MPSYVVTGASKGIGFEFVNQLSADDGNTVFAIVRSKATATELSGLSRKNLTILEADVTDPKAVQRAATEVSKVTDGKLDYFINNAGKNNHPGFTIDGFPTPEALEDDLLDMFKTNTVSAIHSINAFLPLVKKGSGKKVLILSTGLADVDSTVYAGVIGQVTYSIAKVALNMAVAKYAATYKDEGIIFLAISPGIVATAMQPTPMDAPEELKMMGAVLAKMAPPDFKGPITPEESVQKMMEVFNRWTIEETGAFVSHYGNKQWL